MLLESLKIGICGYSKEWQIFPSSLPLPTFYCISFLSFPYLSHAIERFCSQARL